MGMVVHSYYLSALSDGMKGERDATVFIVSLGLVTL